MAAKEHGTSYLFGVNGTITNCKVQSCQIAKSDALNLFVLDENGRRVASRHDDEEVLYDIEAIPQASGFTEPAIADIFSYLGINTRIVSKNFNLVNTEHGRFGIQVATNEYLTLS